MLLDAQLSPVVAWSRQLHSCQLSRARPSPQSEWDCLKLAGGRARTALGALTQAATSPPFPESGSCLSFLSAGKPALGQGPEDGTQICRVTLTLLPAPWGWHSLPRPLLPGPPVALSLLHRIWAPASPCPWPPQRAATRESISTAV